MSHAMHSTSYIIQDFQNLFHPNIPWWDAVTVDYEALIPHQKTII